MNAIAFYTRLKIPTVALTYTYFCIQQIYFRVQRMIAL